MIAPARSAAFTALCAVNAGRLDLPAALVEVRPTLQDERDRSLATDLVTGTLRWQGELDVIIEHHARRPLSKLDFEVLQILRLGVYQLLHLDRVPAAAAVNDAVALTRRARKTSATGLVNAILRAASRNRHRLPLPAAPPDGDPLDYLERTLSHPRWLAARWLHRHGFESAAAREAFNNQPAPMTLRVNTLKASAQEVVDRLGQQKVLLAPARYAPAAFTVTEGNPLRTTLASSGLFFLQDEASQLVALLAAGDPGSRVLDACASPGGKTTAIAAMTAGARIVAADVRSARMRLLRETVAASGAGDIRLVQLDLLEGVPFGPMFDLVFVDAPCSGLGTIRRDPEIRWRRLEADLALLSADQRQMISNAARAVRPGGRLVYSTCSSEPEENEDVVRAFLERQGDGAAFRTVHLRSEPPRLFSVLEPVIDADGFLRTRPEAHHLEAFFGAVLQRVK